MVTGPEGDPAWQAVAAFIEQHAGDHDPIVGPQELGALLREPIRHHGEALADEGGLRWLVVHKGQMDEIDPRFLTLTDRDLEPVFANEVFVVFSRHPLPVLPQDDLHHRAYRERRADLFDSLLGGRSLPAQRRPQPGQVRSVYLGDHRALTELQGGHKLLVDTRDLSLAPHLLLDGTWEQWLTDALSAILRPGMTFVDVGANFGYYTVLAAARVGSTGRVFAFEANPDIADLLWQTVNINGFGDRTTVVPKAVYSEATTVSLSRLERLLGASRLAPFEDELLAEYHDRASTIDVPAVSLDDHFADLPGPVDVVKIDAEGSEPFVLEGMTGLLERNPHMTVIFEYAPGGIRSSGHDPEALLESITERGFTLRRISHDGAIVPIAPDELPDDGSHCELVLTGDRSDASPGPA